MDKLTRSDLKIIYKHMTLSERRQLAKHLGNSMPTMRRYCLEPYSEVISNKLWNNMLILWDYNIWLSKLERAKKFESGDNCEIAITNSALTLEINFINYNEKVLPDTILINGIAYKKCN